MAPLAAVAGRCVLFPDGKVIAPVPLNVTFWLRSIVIAATLAVCNCRLPLTSTVCVRPAALALILVVIYFYALYVPDCVNFTTVYNPLVVTVGVPVTTPVYFVV
jgi:hypothetical protein